MIFTLRELEPFSTIFESIETQLRVGKFRVRYADGSDGVLNFAKNVRFFFYWPNDIEEPLQQVDPSRSPMEYCISFGEVYRNFLTPRLCAQPPSLNRPASWPIVYDIYAYIIM